MLEREATRSWMRPAVDPLPLRERRGLHDDELHRGVQELGGVVELVLGADDPTELLDPRDLLVADVPDHREAPAPLEDPAYLGQRALVVEPVEALGSDDHVVGVVGGRDLLGRGDRGTDVGQPVLEDREHRLVGVGGVHVVTERDQLLGELAGAGAELQDAERLGPGEPHRGLCGETRATAVVGLCHPAEGPGRLRRPGCSGCSLSLTSARLPPATLRPWLPIPLLGWCLSRASPRRTPPSATAST